MRIAVGLALLLTACTDPSVNANVRVTPDGVKVVPYATTRVGDLNVTVSP